MIIYELGFQVHHASTFMAGPLQKTLAYIDPGSGSFILQILLATLLASLFFMKNFWRKVIGIFKKPSSPEQDDDPDAEK
jgi:hypothetical protein